MLVKLEHGRARTVEDLFVAVGDDESLPHGAIVVPLKRFLAETTPLLARETPLGVRLETGDTPQILGEHIHRLALIVLHVPYFKDGRGFSWARLARTRLGYTGEIRVTGHFLKDQMAFYARVGVDVFDIAQNIPFAQIEAAFSEISNVYQPAFDGRATIRELRAAKRAAATISTS
ncbi:MAG TPA: DUF934 domain-containing protein [Micropepsaceae bacterium]|jgi:uncharacterized protein (DUF934 family)